jgi:hypothetical protein
MWWVYTRGGTYIRGGLYSEVYGIAVSYMTRFYRYLENCLINKVLRKTTGGFALINIFLVS